MTHLLLSRALKDGGNGFVIRITRNLTEYGNEVNIETRGENKTDMIQKVGDFLKNPQTSFSRSKWR